MKLLTIMTRIGNDGINYINDLAHCLSIQMDLDFEWLLLVRPEAHLKSQLLMETIESFENLVPRTRLVMSPTESRSRILNCGLEYIKGEMFCTVDDDDLILPNFVQVNNEYASRNSFQIAVRSNALLMECMDYSIDGFSVLQQVAPVQRPWPLVFNYDQHLNQNLTPNFAVAYPTAIVMNTCIKWDENLTAVEDWDFLMQYSQKGPILSIQEELGIYRRLVGRSRSEIQETATAWSDSEKRVLKKNYHGTFQSRVFGKISWTMSREFRSYKLTILRRRISRALVKFPHIHRIVKVFYRKFQRRDQNA